MNVHARHVPTPEKLVGSFRRFGVEGSDYEVISIDDGTPDGDVYLQVQVVETRETLDYRFTHIVNDPKEA